MTLLQQALEALTESVDLVEYDYTCDWRHGISQRKAQLEGKRQGVEAHKAAITALRAAIDAGAVVQQGWRPISEAPKDFVTVFDGWNGERVVDVTWAHPEYSPKGHYDWCVSEYTNGHGWSDVGVRGLTHWMPTPPEPITQEDGK